MNLIQSLKQSAIALLLNLPPGLQLKLAGGGIIRRDGRTLDLQLQVLIAISKKVPRYYGKPPVHARKIFQSTTALLSRDPVGLPKIEDKMIPVQGANIAVRIYNPNPEDHNQPLLLYFHGGGHVVGNLETHDPLCRKISYRANCMLISVDYRLAPEHPFPIPLLDCFEAYKWVLENAKLLGVNSKQIVVGGDSAGGQLAIATCLKCKTEKVELPMATLLFYPMTDVSQESKSYEIFSEGFLLERESMRWFVRLHTPNETDRRSSLASPLLADNLKGFPKTYLATAGFDPLRDEGHAFAERLKSFQVDVHYKEYPSLIHGYVSINEWIDSCENALNDAILYLRNQFQIAK